MALMAGKWIAQDRGALDCEEAIPDPVKPPPVFPLVDRLSLNDRMALQMFRDCLPAVRAV